jgi:DNA-binding SARP family transcriptional activator
VAAALAERTQLELVPAPSPARADAAVLYSFGDPTVLEIGESRNVLRRTKLVELIADLAVHGGSMDRDLLQERLFPEVDRSRAGNYFRQVVFKIRELLGVSLRRDGNLLIWPEEIPLRAVDVEFERRITEGAADEPKHEESWGTALDHASSLYLPASELPWVVERRNLLSLLYEKAVVTELHAAFKAGALEQVRAYGTRAIATNPYAEDLYLLMIRAEQRWGSVARARALFRAAQESMTDLGIDVSDELRDAAQGAGAAPL